MPKIPTPKEGILQDDIDSILPIVND